MKIKKGSKNRRGLKVCDMPAFGRKTFLSSPGGTAKLFFI